MLAPLDIVTDPELLCKDDPLLIDTNPLLPVPAPSPSPSPSPTADVLTTVFDVPDRLSTPPFVTPASIGDDNTPSDMPALTITEPADSRPDPDDIVTLPPETDP